MTINRQRLFFSELTVARELVTITCISVKAQSQAGEWESFTEEKREAFRNAPEAGFGQSLPAFLIFTLTSN